MKLSRLTILFPLGAWGLALGACPDDKTTGSPDGATSADAGDTTVTSPDGSDATSAETVATDGTSPTDTPETNDTSDTTDTETDVVAPETCDDPIPAAPEGTLCGVVDGNDQALLIRADLVLPNGIQERGQLLIVNGAIACVGCDCLAKPEAAGATVFNCPEALVSPGLINAHDHITYSQGDPIVHGTTRWDHRNEWRSGPKKITYTQNEGGMGDAWAEMRQVMAGQTSLFGSGGERGMLRNLDVGTKLEGLSHGTADYDTFPLGSSGIYDTGCGSYELPQSSVLNQDAWVPHVAEGVSAGARNEFTCLDGEQQGGIDVVEDNVAFIHAVGTTSRDIALFAENGGSLVWSPRSNTDLYGFTAFAPIFHRMGARIALGTDWTYSGSMNVLRELRCAQDWNGRWGNYFTDAQLVGMVTSGAASALGFDDVLGALAVGKIADLAVWDAREHKGFRAILDAGAADVALVLRGGTPPSIGGQTYYRRGRPLFGEAALVTALSDRELDYANYDPAVYSATAAGKKRLPPACEAIEVCGKQKSFCIAEQLEGPKSGSTYYETYALADLNAALGSQNTYDLFFCGTPTNEPSCVPFRPGEFDGIGAGSDDDGDGVPSGQDNCPGYFNAIRPMDGAAQPDTDGDTVGDLCDPCPLNANTTACASVNPDDIDEDGILNGGDNCPSDPNKEQGDRDTDGIGDVCDACPDESNLNGHPCSSTVPAVKKGDIKAGTKVGLPNLVVTAVGSNFYTVQVPGVTGADALYTGLYVYAGAGTKPALGNHIDLVGTTSDFHGQVQLEDATATVLVTPVEIPAPVVVTAADIAPGATTEKAYEGMLVEIRNTTVTSTTPTPITSGTSTETVTNEFVLTGDVRVDDALFLITPPVTVGQSFTALRGVLVYAWNRDKLLPRSAADVASGPPEVAAVTPSEAVVYAGTNAATFTIQLTSPAQGATTVTVSSSDPAVAAVADVVVADGQTSAALAVEAKVAGGPITITAKIGSGLEQSATVTVVAADTVPKPVKVEAQAAVLIGEDFDVTVTLDLPAKEGGQMVTFSATGPVTFPQSATVQAGQRVVTVTATAGAEAGAVTIEAATSAGTASTALEVVDVEPVGLLLVEVFYNPPSTDSTYEWVKLYNGTDAAIDLAGYTLAWGGPKDWSWGHVDLVGTVQPGACFIVGGPVSSAANGSPVFDQSIDLDQDLQNSSVAPADPADAVALFAPRVGPLSAATLPIDIVVYGPSNKTGFLGPDGQIAPVHSSDAGTGKSLVRATTTTWVIGDVPNATACIVILQ